MLEELTNGETVPVKVLEEPFSLSSSLLCSSSSLLFLTSKLLVMTIRTGYLSFDFLDFNPEELSLLVMTAFMSLLSLDQLKR
jgi:hypothetical protein